MSALKLLPAARTHLGRRANNEDSVFASVRMAAVADGMGGATGGEVASRIVIDALAHLDKGRLCGSLDRELQSAVINGNEALSFLVSREPELAGMGTTLTAVALSDDGCYVIANVGDSRTYLFRAGRLRQLTRDGSFVQALLDWGAITEAQARRHPQRSVVLDALDGSPRDTVAMGTVRAIVGDRLLLCSDGLSDVVTDAAIAAALTEPSRDACAEQLIDLALQAGGRDNISVLVADVVEPGGATVLWPPALLPSP
jgi:serine/threonine protein phosphatase PrpC